MNDPTYYPKEASIASAKAVLIAAGTIVDGVNFSQYVPASSTATFGARGNLPPPRPPGSTGALSGVIHYSDGRPASGITVIVVPASGQFPVRQVGNISSPVVTLVVTDTTGRYRFQGVSPDTYKIVAGYSDSPAFYPGTSDIRTAAAITTISTTALDTLDFKIPAVTGTSVHVRVSDIGGKPAGGATVELHRIDSPVSMATYFLPVRTYKAVLTAGDGSAEIAGVIPGKYSI